MALLGTVKERRADVGCRIRSSGGGVANRERDEMRRRTDDGTGDELSVTVASADGMDADGEWNGARKT